MITVYKVSVHVYRPVSGIFTRMTVTGQTHQRLGPWGTSFTVRAVYEGGWVWEF